MVLENGQDVEEGEPQTPELPSETIGRHSPPQEYQTSEDETDGDRRRETVDLKRPEGRAHDGPNQHGNRNGPPCQPIAMDQRDSLSPSSLISFLVLEIPNLHRCENDSGYDGDPVICCAMQGDVVTRGDLDGAGAVARVGGSEQKVTGDVILRAAKLVVHPVQAGQQHGFFHAAKIEACADDDGDTDKEELHRLVAADPPGCYWAP